MAGETYAKRYGGGFVDLPTQTTPIDSQFLNAVETALVRVLGEDPAVDEVPIWDAGLSRFKFQKLSNAQIDAAAAIDKSKLAALNIVDADIAGAAAISGTKLASGIPASKLTATGAFSAYKSADQTGIVTSTDTKVTFNTEEYDVSGWFDAATNSRFQPLVAGIYRLSFVVSWGPTSMADNVRVIHQIFKNGALHRFVNVEHYAGAADDSRWNGTCQVRANGTTDYFELFVTHNAGANRDLRSGVESTRFEGHLIGTE
jgi:hypothetical protein